MNATSLLCVMTHSVYDNNYFWIRVRTLGGAHEEVNGFWERVHRRGRVSLTRRRAPQYGRTPHRIAATAPSSREAVMKALLVAGADADARDKVRRSES